MDRPKHGFIDHPNMAFPKKARQSHGLSGLGRPNAVSDAWNFCHRNNYGSFAVAYCLVPLRMKGTADFSMPRCKMPFT